MASSWLWVSFNLWVPHSSIILSAVGHAVASELLSGLKPHLRISRQNHCYRILRANWYEQGATQIVNWEQVQILGHEPFLTICKPILHNICRIRLHHGLKLCGCVVVSRPWRGCLIPSFQLSFRSWGLGTSSCVLAFPRSGQHVHS